MRQEAFPPEKSKTPNPREHSCEWCGETATAVKQIKHKMGRGHVWTGMYLFACPAHRPTLDKTIAARAGERMRR